MPRTPKTGGIFVRCPTRQSHLSEKANFYCLYPQLYSSSYFPGLVITAEGRFIDWQLHFDSLLSSLRRTCTSHHCRCDTSWSVNPSLFPLSSFVSKPLRYWNSSAWGSNLERTLHPLPAQNYSLRYEGVHSSSALNCSSAGDHHLMKLREPHHEQKSRDKILRQPKWKHNVCPLQNSEQHWW